MELSIEQRREICQLLGVNISYAEHLLVKASDGEELVMLTLNDRYLDLSGDPLARTVRGLVWSLPEKRIVCATGVISLISTTDEVGLEVEENHLQLTTTTLVKTGRISAEEASSSERGPGGKFLDGRRKVENLHTLPVERCLIMPNYDGVKVNVFLYKGQVYFATNGNLFIFGRRDDGTEYRGGVWRPGSITYGQQFELMLGDRHRISSMLFPTPQETYNSPWCYSFYLVHPSSFLNTTLKTGDQGFCIYYGAFNSGSVEVREPPFDFDTHFAKETGVKVVDQYPYAAARPPTKPFVVNAANMLNPNRSALLNLEEAANVLRFGLPDPNKASRDFFNRMYAEGKWPLVPAESLTITYLPESSDADPNPTYQRFRVRSPAFAFREFIHDNSNQFYQQYLKLVQGGSYQLPDTEEKLERLLEWIKVLPKPADFGLVEREINAGRPICDAELYLPAEISRLTQDQLVLALSYLYVLISNPHNQGLGLRFFSRFVVDRELAINWLQPRVETLYPKTPVAASGGPVPDNLALFYQRFLLKVLGRVNRDRRDYEAGAVKILGKAEVARRRNGLIHGYLEDAVKSFDARALIDLFKLVGLVTGKTTLQIADPSAPAVSKSTFPTLAGAGRKSASSKKSPVKGRSSRAASSSPVKGV